MGQYQSCPECGDTNHEENWNNVRTFDCGFQGQFDKRVNRCEGTKKPKPVIERIVDDSAARFRLGLLDAAQAVDGIATDLAASGGEDEYSQRCRELAQQMRQLAGHESALSASSRNTSIVTFFKRKWR